MDSSLDSAPHRRSKISFVTPSLAAAAALIAVGSFTISYDSAWWSGCLANAYFNRTWGTGTLAVGPNEAIPWLSASQQSGFAATGNCGLAFGSMVSGSISERYGLKPSLYVASALLTIGTIIEATSGPLNGYRWVQLMIGKTVLGVTCGFTVSIIPSYLAGISPAPIRGAIIMCSQIVASFGGLAASGLSLWLSTQTGPKVWWLPMFLQLTGPVSIVTGMLLVPESPRWLIEHGKIDEARVALSRLRKGLEAYSVDEEIRLVTHDVQVEYNKDHSSWIELFRGTNLRRTWIAVSLNCFEIGAGFSYFASYLVLMMVTVGFPQPFLFAVVVCIISLAFGFASFFTLEIFGRRKLLLWGATGTSVCLLVFGTLVTIYEQPEGRIADVCVASLMLWFFFLSTGWGPVLAVAVPELPSDQCRQKTVGLVNFCGYVISLIVSTVSPYISDEQYGNLGPKITWIYAFFSCVAVIWAYLFFPETRGRRLEELDMLFNLKVPARRFAEYDLGGAAGQPITLDYVKKIDADHIENVNMEDIDQKEA